MDDKILSFMSIDELKISSLIVVLLLLIIVASVQCFMNGDIANNLKELIEVVIFAITGVNIANVLGKSK